MKILTALGVLMAMALTCFFVGRSAMGDAKSDQQSIKPGLHLESAMFVGDGGNLRILSAPILNSLGSVSQRVDIALAFSIADDGKLKIDSLTATPTVLALKPAEQFIPGVYKGFDGSTFTLHGPSVSQGGRTSWSFNLTERSKTPAWGRFDAAWTTGAAAGNPDLNGIGDTKTLPEGFAFGMNTADRGTNLIGARQIGQSVQVADFRQVEGNWRESDMAIFVLQQ